MKRFLNLGTICVIAHLALSSTVARGQDPLTYNWEAHGKAMHRGPKFIPDAALARKVVLSVAEQLIKMKVPPNHNIGGRIVSGGKYGQLDVGTCTWLNDAIQKSLLGAGFRKDQIFGVVGHANLPSRASFLWVNQDHIAPALVIGKQVLTFDLWSHAYNTGAYRGFASAQWNGMSLAKWCVGVQHYVNFSYARYGQSHLLDGPWDPDYLDDEIQKDQLRQRFPQKAPPKKAVPKPKPPAKMSEAYWEFVAAAPAPIKDEVMRDPRRYFRYKVEGGEGSLTVTSTWNDMRLDVHSCSSILNWTITGDYKKLKPGQTIDIRGSVALSGEINGTIIGLDWHLPGFPAHVAHASGIKVFSMDVPATSSSATFEKKGIAVPEKTAFPGGAMVLRFITSARGYGALEYTYRWVEK